jgi:hypothetical protein
MWQFFLNFGQILAIENLEKHLILALLIPVTRKVRHLYMEVYCRIVGMVILCGFRMQIPDGFI